MAGAACTFGSMGGGATRSSRWPVAGESEARVRVPLPFVLAALSCSAAGWATWRIVSTLAAQGYPSLELHALSALTVIHEIPRALRDVGVAAAGVAVWLASASALARGSRPLVVRLGHWVRAPVAFVLDRGAKLPKSLSIGACALATVALGAGYAAARTQLPPPADGPNVLLIVMDTVRSANLSLYGHRRETTPQLDAFARNAVVFDNAFAIAPWTIPNHASMFTGRYACDHGATQESKFLSPSAITVSELLLNHGYDTGGITSNANVASRKGFAQGFGWYVDLWRDAVREHYESGQPVPEGDAGAFATANAALAWLDRPRDGRPWFLFLNYIEAHSPYDPAPHLRSAFLPAEPSLSPHVREYDYVDFLAGAYQMSDRDFETAEALYDAEIRYLDQQIGALLSRLERVGHLDDTLVIITSDHGESFGEHGLVGHQFGLYDPVLRVPLIVRPPGARATGERRSERVELTDLFATILEATGAPTPAEAVRPSVFAHETRAANIAEYYRPLKYLRKLAKRHPDFDASGFDRRLRSVREGAYKFIWSSEGRHELYHLESDAGEMRDLAAGRIEDVARMASFLDDWSERCDEQVALAAKAEPEIDDEMREKLRALGYVE